MAGYKKHIFVCENVRPESSGRVSCGSRRTAELRLNLKTILKQNGLHKKYRVNSSGCLGHCSKGPVMVIYPQGLWYSGFNANDLEEIVAESIIADKEIARLLIK